MRQLRHIHSHSAHEFPFDTLSRNAQLSIAVLSTAFSFIDKFQRRSIKLFRVRRNSRWMSMSIAVRYSRPAAKRTWSCRAWTSSRTKQRPTSEKKKYFYLWFCCMIHRPRCVAATMTRRLLHIHTMFGCRQPALIDFSLDLLLSFSLLLSLFIWRWFLFHFFVYSTPVTSNYFGLQFSFRSLFFLFCHRLPRISHFVRQTKKNNPHVIIHWMSFVRLLITFCPLSYAVHSK